MNRETFREIASPEEIGEPTWSAREEEDYQDGQWVDDNNKLRRKIEALEKSLTEVLDEIDNEQFTYFISDKVIERAKKILGGE